jgi:hypothetical protein
MRAPEDRPSTIELIELSDLAWTIVDPDGEHEQLERAWSSALPHGWPPPADIEQLRARLTEVADALRPGAEAGLLELVAAVIVYLAGRPERRRVEQVVFGEALREAYAEEVPAEITTWLATHPSLAPHTRHHGAPAPRRHVHSRPPAAPDASGGT